jgi:hypothetical protein
VAQALHVKVRFAAHLTRDSLFGGIEQWPGEIGLGNRGFEIDAHGTARYWSVGIAYCFAAASAVKPFTSSV